MCWSISKTFFEHTGKNHAGLTTEELTVELDPVESHYSAHLTQHVKVVLVNAERPDTGVVEMSGTEQIGVDFLGDTEHLGAILDPASVPMYEICHPLFVCRIAGLTPAKQFLPYQ